MRHPVGQAPGYDERRWRADARIGLGLDWREFELQAGWTGAQQRSAEAAAPYAGTPRRRRSAWVLSAAFFF